MINKEIHNNILPDSQLSPSSHLVDYKPFVGSGITLKMETKEENRSWIIYKTTNLVNGKIYIGQQSTKRKAYIGSGTFIKKAIKKYGAENFSKEVLCDCYTQREANEKEQYYIELFDSTNPKIGYNMLKSIVTEEAIRESPIYKERHKKALIEFHASEDGKKKSQKHSGIMKEYYSKEENKKAQSERIKNFFKSEDARKNMSEKTKAYNESEAGQKRKEKRIVALLKKVTDPEHKKIQAEKIKAYRQTEKGKESIEKGRIKAKALFKDKNFLDKLSSAQLKHYSNEENAKKISENRKAYFANPENKAKFLAAQKAGKEKKIQSGYVFKRPEKRTIIKVSFDGFVVDVYESVALAARENNLCKHLLSRRLKNKNYNWAGGFYWY